MKSFSTSSSGPERTGAGWWLLAALASWCVACAAGPPTLKLEDLTNPLLGVEYSQWLVGPVSHIASPQETRDYLALHDDAAAAAFIDSFWSRHNPTPQAPRNPLLATFEERGAEADRQFSEAGHLGRRTDRGTVWVLYGPPRKTEFEVSPAPGEPPIELWSYGGDAPPGPLGLDGRRPAAQYRFIKRGELTVTYAPLAQDPRLQVVAPE